MNIPASFLSICMSVTLLCSGITHAEEVVVATPSKNKVIVANVSSKELPTLQETLPLETAPAVANVKPLEAVTDKPLKIGKHVSQEIDLLSMIISLSVVLLIILISAFLLKRVQGGSTSLNGLKLISSLHLGTKEKVVVVQAGKQQWLLGVTPQQINVLSELAEPLNDSLKNEGDGEIPTNNIPPILAKIFNKST